jgi:hypothetical protein
MKEPEMEIIAGLIHQALSATTDAPRLQKLEAQVKELCRSYPLLFSEEWLLDQPGPACAARSSF